MAAQAVFELDNKAAHCLTPVSGYPSSNTGNQNPPRIPNPVVVDPLPENTNIKTTASPAPEEKGCYESLKKRKEIRELAEIFGNSRIA